MNYLSSLRLSPHREMTPEGFLIVRDCAIANLGGRKFAASEIPGAKADSAGWIYVFRDSNELFSPETLASFEGKPLTLDHPADTALLDSETVGRYRVGHVQNVRRGTGAQSDSIVADVVIENQAAIDAVAAGIKDLSAGYLSDTKDIGDGVAVEHSIRGNHVAIVPRGRCGSLVALRDAAFRGNQPMTEDTKTAPASEDKKQDDASAVGTGGGTPAQPDDFAAIVKGLQEQLAALTERVAALEPKTDAEGEDKPKAEDDKQPAAQPKADAKPLSRNDVAAIVKAQLEAQASKAKADSAAIADAALIAPGLSRDTPDLAKQACIEYAKTDSGRAVIEAMGGMKAVEANPKEVLHQAAIHQRLLSDTPLVGRPKTDSAATPKTDFFAQAEKLWSE